MQLSTLEFNGKEQVSVTEQQFEQLLNAIGMNWWGFDSWTGTDSILFTDKMQCKVDVEVDTRYETIVLYNMDYDHDKYDNI